jgi:predicted nucleotidyltransferase
LDILIEEKSKGKPMQKNLFEIIKTRLNETYSPLSLYVFGSYAWGNPTKDSDVDLVVVVESSDQKPYKRAVKGIRALRGLGIAKDILVYTKEEFKTLSQDVSSLLYKVEKEGIKLI